MIGDSFPAVLVAAQHGDRAALETIYRDVAPLVLGYLRANRADDPENLAGEVMTSLVSGLSAFSGDESHFRSWLLTIAHRRLVDQYRRSARRPEELRADPTEAHLREPFDDNESQAMSRLRVLGVLDAIDELTPDQRSALLLRALADLPTSQIARAMGKPESAVKALLRRGTATLRRQIATSQGAW
jgi:RNA polymerase sigma factor (sigma-70 family)